VQFRSPVSASARFGMRALDLLDRHPGAEIPALLGLTSRRLLITQSLGSVGRAYFYEGDIPRARDWMTRARDSDGAAYPVYQVNILGSLALLDAWEGNLTRAEELANQALDLAAECGLVSHPAPADAYFALARVSFGRAEPAEAAAWQYEGAARALSNNRTPLMWIGHLLSRMGNDLGVAAPLGSTSGDAPNIVRDELLVLDARALRIAGDAEQARKMLESSSSLSAGVSAERIATALTLGDVWGARHGLQESGSLPGAGSSAGSLRTRVERLALGAWLAHLESRGRDAQDLLAAALDLAGTEQLVDVLAGLGPTFTGLISAPGSRDPGFTRLVVARGRNGIVATPTASVVLTDREREILLYLPTRLSNAEIAARHFLSVNTVKTHMAHMYQKLEVSNRDSAISRARELGLLP